MSDPEIDLIASILKGDIKRADYTWYITGQIGSERGYDKKGYCGWFVCEPVFSQYKIGDIVYKYTDAEDEHNGWLIIVDKITGRNKTIIMKPIHLEDMSVDLIATTLKGDWEQEIHADIEKYVERNHTFENSLQIIDEYLTFAVHPDGLKDDKLYNSNETRFIKFDDCIVEYDSVVIVHSKLAIVKWKMVHKIFGGQCLIKK